jgi:hypothetical protein
MQYLHKSEREMMETQGLRTFVVTTSVDDEVEVIE